MARTKLKEYISSRKTLNNTIAAEKLGISRNHFQCILSGRRNPSLAVAVRIEKLTKGKVKPSHWGNV